MVRGHGLFVAWGHLLYCGKWVRGTAKLLLAGARTQTFVKACPVRRVVYLIDVGRCTRKPAVLLPSVLTCSMYLALSIGIAGPRDLSHTQNVVPINKVASAGWLRPQPNII